MENPDLVLQETGSRLTYSRLNYVPPWDTLRRAAISSFSEQKDTHHARPQFMNVQRQKKNGKEKPWSLHCLQPHYHGLSTSLSSFRVLLRQANRIVICGCQPTVHSWKACLVLRVNRLTLASSSESMSRHNLCCVKWSKTPAVTSWSLGPNCSLSHSL